MSDQVLPNHTEDTKVLAFHLYTEDWKEFMVICRRLKKFHSEVLRALVQNFNEKNKEQSEESGASLDEIFGEESKVKVAY